LTHNGYPTLGPALKIAYAWPQSIGGRIGNEAT
jgi:hypothetical protein